MFQKFIVKQHKRASYQLFRIIIVKTGIVIKEINVSEGYRETGVAKLYQKRGVNVKRFKGGIEKREQP